MANPLSWYFHHLPRRFHRFEVLGNHFAQLVAPVFLFAPQPIAGVAGLIVLGTQGWLVLSGNFAWLNVVTMALAILSLDDTTLGLVGLRVPERAQELGGGFGEGIPLWFGALVLALTALVVFLSYRPARNLLSRRQLMNYSFDPFHIVGTYGAFGSVTKERDEVIVSGTAEVALTPQTTWLEYEFKGKPGDVRRRPPQYAPYHLRLDWLMWVAAFSSPRYHEWFMPLLGRLLEGDRPTLRLLRRNPFPDRPPAVVPARRRLDRFTPPAGRRASPDRPAPT